MKTLLAPLATLMITTGPALAHSGAHMHPHGSEPWIFAMGALLVIATALVAWTRK